MFYEPYSLTFSAHSGTFSKPVIKAFVVQTSFSKQNKRTVIKFFVLLHKSPKEIHGLIAQALGSKSPSYDIVSWWVCAVLDDKEDVEDRRAVEDQC